MLLVPRKLVLFNFDEIDEKLLNCYLATIYGAFEKI